MRYKALNGTWYRIAYYMGDFRFVHISQNKMQTCTTGKTKNGKKYIEYTGPFEMVDGTISIY
jgi:hypothetical protein